MKSDAKSVNLIDLGFNLVLGKFIERINRFMILVEVDCGEVYAHLSNSGRLSTALRPGDVTYLRRIERMVRRKSAYTIFAVRHDDVFVIIDAQFSNFIARRAIELGLIEDLAGYTIVKENFSVNGSRLDFVLEKGLDKFYVEVKSVTHVVNGVALFPDAPTLRGKRHIRQLASLSALGLRAGILFSVQRPDAIVVRPNSDVDPEFAVLLKEAVEAGVKVFTLKSSFQPPKTIVLEPNIPLFQL
ncbi:DNA/RNA nuclease SfsA [Candidatus Bathyarchaeota archaeon]|nr:DNA/RNA nuclease SfsA [Candidatus Bathyarchaeota archaeon]